MPKKKNKKKIKVFKALMEGIQEATKLRAEGKIKLGGIGDTEPNEPHKSLRMIPMIPYDLVREDGRLERVCKHGIGHTVGHQNSDRLKENWIWVHGCDGCCHIYLRMKP